ncbi:NAD(P)-dependent oxidoreductase [Clostridium sp. KNHs205]|jgi:UDP-glucuronate decarboxylase|uniref:NAD-dependent epimerase/dehydratase family protein n=1 Tax=Clostridium sp. KNHs205 TaxID=1449050 RepID=UPI00068F172D|nr:NAD(P)-dependent oxidoreductase [Clostridium sp. KNHs205]
MRENKNYLITGATGYIGSKIVDYLYEKNSNDKLSIVVRDASKVGSIREKVEIIEADLTSKDIVGKVQGCWDYIIHCAAITNSSKMVASPVETIESIVNTTQNIMKLACRYQPKSIVYLSSMEVYGKVDCNEGNRISENELGEIDIFNVRSCYPLGKRMAENICYSYYKEYNIPVKIARLAQTFGSGVLLSDTRVFAQFAKAAKTGNNIILHTHGNSMGNYCGIEDSVVGIMTILEKGISGEAYNVVNEENTMSIRQVAELVASKIADGKIMVTYDIPDNNIYGYAINTTLRLSGQKLMSLGWKPSKSIEDMFRDMISEL